MRNREPIAALGNAIVKVSITGWMGTVSQILLDRISVLMKPLVNPHKKKTPLCTMRSERILHFEVHYKYAPKLSYTVSRLDWVEGCAGAKKQSRWVEIYQLEQCKEVGRLAGDADDPLAGCQCSNSTGERRSRSESEIVARASLVSSPLEMFQTAEQCEIGNRD